MQTATINGQAVVYRRDTVFKVQIGRGKSAYKDRFTSIGNPFQAVQLYRGINIGRGYKKRFLIDGKPFVREFS